LAGKSWRRIIEDSGIFQSVKKMLDMLFLMTIGIGYLFALTHLYYTHNARDGHPGLSVQDVVIA
jgi:hypothetical protein